jgi:hypothetical protein
MRMNDLALIVTRRQDNPIVQIAAEAGN